MGLFKYTAPEEEGIPSEAIIAFIKQLQQHHVNMHGFLMLSRDKIVAEAYWRPFHKDFQHRMYSVGKSLTSLAIGFLQEEGKLSLEDAICDYFQDKLPSSGVHPWLGQTRIKDLLKMTSPHSRTTYKQMPGDDWVASFFQVTPTHKPGTLFAYDTSATHVLAALVERLSGMSLMDYLRQQCLDEIGFSKQAKWLKDPMGISQGGSGLICTLQDLAAIAYVCNEGGKYQGKQLMPATYLKEATTKQVDTSLQPFLDEQQGYGYQIWRARHEGFCFFGMGGQLALCFPQHQWVMVTMADTQGAPCGLEAIYDAFYTHIYPVLEGRQSLLPNPKATQALQDVMSQLEVTPILCQGTTYQVVPPLTYYFEANPLHITTCIIQIGKQEGQIDYERHGKRETLLFGINKLVMIPIKEGTCELMSSGNWVSHDTFQIKVAIIGEEFGHIRMNLCFQEDSLSIHMKHAAEQFLNDYEGIFTGYLKH